MVPTLISKHKLKNSKIFLKTSKTSLKPKTIIIEIKETITDKIIYKHEEITLEDNKECILLFLTDGYPNVKTPNEVGEYQYLKSEYPFLKINAVQYEMGNDILEPITKISDKQFVADMENLHNVLFDASIEVTSYERIEIVDYINSEYFYVKDEKDIHPSVGTVKLENEGGKQKVIWIIDNIPSGVKTSLEIVVEVKKSSIETEDVVYMPTNEKEIVTTKLENEEDTWFSKNGQGCIDTMFYSKNIKLLNMKTIATKYSDHYAVYAEFEV